MGGFWEDLGRGVLGVGTLGASEAFRSGGIFNPKAPKAPDFSGAAADDYQSRVNATNAQTQQNRPNQSGPFASTTWDATGQHTGFNGALGGAASSLMDQAAANYGSPMMTGDQARDQAINAAYGQATSRLNPQWDQRESQTKTQLLNQGLDPQSEAYVTALRNFGQDRNDAYSSAMNGAIGQGTQAGSAVFGQNMAAMNNPLQQLQAMQGLTGQPGFTAAGNAGGTNTFGAAQAQGDWDNGQYQAKQQFAGDVLGGATGLASAFAGNPAAGKKK
jgi:hypothetical protein